MGCGDDCLNKLDICLHLIACFKFRCIVTAFVDDGGRLGVVCKYIYKECLDVLILVLKR